MLILSYPIYYIIFLVIVIIYLIYFIRFLINIFHITLEYHFPLFPNVYVINESFSIIFSHLFYIVLFSFNIISFPILVVCLLSSILFRYILPISQLFFFSFSFLSICLHIGLFNHF